MDIGPKAGVHGGEVVACGTQEDVMAEPRSITGDYLAGRRKIDVPEVRSTPDGRWLTVYGCRQNNLKNIDIRIPVGLIKMCIRDSAICARRPVLSAAASA